MAHKLLMKHRIRTEIMTRIVNGIYPPGEFMPTERELAREFRTSLTAISKALTSIKESGLICQAAGHGTRVLPVDERPQHASIALITSNRPPERSKATSIVNGIQRRLNRLHQRCEILYNVDAGEIDDPEAFANRYAGVVFTETLGFEQLALKLERRRFPCVMAKLEKDLDLTATWVDHRRSTCTAVQLLAALGHRKIAFLTRPLEIFFYRHAFEGYQFGLRDVGIEFDDSLIITTRVSRKPSDSSEAYAATKHFLAKHSPPTALIACRDYLAGGACQAFAEAGIKVGHDVSIIGFDNATWPRPMPFLTTFSEPLYELGAVAAEILVERIISGWHPVEKREIEAPLIIRRSVGLCPDPVGFVNHNLMLKLYKKITQTDSGLASDLGRGCRETNDPLSCNTSENNRKKS